MIKSLDLKRINAQHQAELKAACSRVIDSGWYINGDEVSSFEQEFAFFVGTQFSLGVGNGFDALNLSLRTWIEQGLLQVGDEVIVPANTFVASVLAITENNLTPVLAEPDAESFNLSLYSIEQVFTPKTKVILTVHLYGLMAPMSEIMEFAEVNNLLVLEDCAQSHGAELNGIKSGKYGDASAFSFYPGKNLGALGDAGAICSDDPTYIKLASQIANYGANSKYHNELQGVNSRLDEIQAAMLRCKLAHLQHDIETKRNIASLYEAYIENEHVEKPRWNNISEHVFHQYVLKVSQRERFVQYLEQNGIETAIHYPVPINKQGCFNFNDIALPIAEALAESVVSIPISPILEKEDVNHIVQTINEFRL